MFARVSDDLLMRFIDVTKRNDFEAYINEVLEKDISSMENIKIKYPNLNLSEEHVRKATMYYSWCGCDIKNIGIPLEYREVLSFLNDNNRLGNIIRKPPEVIYTLVRECDSTLELNDYNVIMYFNYFRYLADEEKSKIERENSNGYFSIYKEELKDSISSINSSRVLSVFILRQDLLEAIEEELK